MRNDFEAAASALIEVDPYRRSNKTGHNPRTANVSAIDFSAGRGKTGVDLRWHPRKDFKKLPNDQKDELREWMKTQEGKKLMKESRKAIGKAAGSKRRNSDKDSDKKPNRRGRPWLKKLKTAMKTENGLSTVMSVLAEEEKKNSRFVAALSSTPLLSQAPHVSAPPIQREILHPQAQPQISALSTACPATSVHLNSILQNKK